MIGTRSTSGGVRAVESGPSPVHLALAAGALAMAVVAMLSATGHANTASSGSCADHVTAWAADAAPETNGFNNEDIARHTAEVQRAAAEAIAAC